MPGNAIVQVRARRVWDSRGNPTVEAEVRTEGGALGRGIAPAGASRGTREAIDLRDGGPRLRGLDVGLAIASVQERIAPAIVGLDAADQVAVDAAIRDLDRSAQKSQLGGNAVVAASLAALHAGAAAKRAPVWRHVADTWATAPSIPLPEVQIFGGGAHADRRVDVQDFMVMVPGASSFEEALAVTAEIYHAAGAILSESGRRFGVADEGGWWPAFVSNEEALETLVRAIERAGETPGERVAISLDVAASEFGRGGRYRLALENRALDSAGMIDMLGRWIERYPIVSVEDPLAEDDPRGMREFTKAFGRRVQVVGDDFLVTNAGLIRDAAAGGACNTALIKVNQVGTVSEAVEALQAAQAAGWRTIVSARSGETEDVSISHLAVGLGAGQLKVGSFSRSERMAKWNECLRIEEELGAASFAGAAPLAGKEWRRGRAQS